MRLKKRAVEVHRHPALRKQEKTANSKARKLTHLVGFKA